MNWPLIVLVATGALAGPVIAGVVAPGLMADLAERGLAVRHRHFVFDEDITVRDAEQVYHIHLAEGDLYELPLTTQVVLRGTVTPTPDDATLHAAFQRALAKLPFPVLSHEVERVGEELTVRATLPAGIVANLSPRYRAVLEAYEA